MAGGAGEFSYTNNSKIQSSHIVHIKPVLQQEISELNLSHGRPVRVADLGCSVGANTLTYAKILFQSAVDNLRAQSDKIPDVQYYFSDLPSNDFNTLLQQLEQLDVMGNRVETGDGKKFYASAVPGSFYGRLFAAPSLDVVISTICLHWISQVPRAFIDKASSAYNKGWTGIVGAKPEVIDTFAHISQRDLRVFLQTRADEVVSGGLVVLLIPSRAKENQPAEGADYTSPYRTVFEETREELVAEI